MDTLSTSEDNKTCRTAISEAGVSAGSPAHIPARQVPHDLALQVGFETLLTQGLSDTNLRGLGAERDEHKVRIPALGRVLTVDLAVRDVYVGDIGRAKRPWAVLAVHYLCADDVTLDDREVSFAHFADCRGYVNVFEKRIVGRFLATAGRTAQGFVELADQLHATRLPGSGDRYRFDVLPRVPIVIVRHEGDAEFGPGASVVYRADIEHLLPAEDRVVVTELVLDSLAGKPIQELVGGAR